MKYKVETKEEVRITYLVTASSEEEAQELVANGEFDNILSEYTNGLEFENVSELSAGYIDPRYLDDNVNSEEEL